MDLVERATNQLVKDLKSNNLWDKLKCVYPSIGSTKKRPRNFNLKDIPKYRRIDKIKKIWKK